MGAQIRKVKLLCITKLEISVKLIFTMTYRQLFYGQLNEERIIAFLFLIAFRQPEIKYEMNLFLYRLNFL